MIKLLIIVFIVSFVSSHISYRWGRRDAVECIEDALKEAGLGDFDIKYKEK